MTQPAFDPITDAHVERSREGYRLMRQHDPAFLERFDAEIEWTASDTLPGGGVLHGTWAVLEFMEGADKLWEDAHPDAEEFLVAGDTLVVLGTWRGKARATGALVEAPFAHVQQFREGRMVTFRNYIDTAKVLQSLEHATTA